jgi:hypothetical protein
MTTRAFFLLATLLTAVPAWTLDLKGVELGKIATRTQLTESLGLNFGESYCRMHRDMPPDERAGSYRCDGGTTIEGVHAYVEVTFTSTDVIDQIQVNLLPGYFDQIAAAAARKWGKPAITRATLRNGFGAQYAEVIHEWKVDGGSAALYQVDPSDVSHALLLLKSHVEAAPDPSKSRM